MATESPGAVGNLRRFASARISSGYLAVSLRWLILAVLALQLSDGLRPPRLHLFTISYWTLTYDYGFIRRGLGGSLIQLVTGDISIAKIYVVVWTITLAALAALGYLLWRLIKEGSVASLVLAAALASSPFAFEFVGSLRGPELLVVPIYVIVCLFPEQLRGWKGLLVGLWFALAVFVHESVGIVAVPWTLFVIATNLDRGESGAKALRSLVIRSAPVLGPALVATLAVAAFGLKNVDAQAIAGLKADQAWFDTTRGLTLFDWIDFSAKDAVVEVYETFTLINLVGIVFAISITALMLAVARNIAKVEFSAGLTAIESSMVRNLVGAGVVLGTVLLYATGLDWTRWCAEVALFWLIAVAGWHVRNTGIRSEAAPVVDNEARDYTRADLLSAALAFLFLAGLAPIQWKESLGHVAYSTIRGMAVTAFAAVLVGAVALVRHRRSRSG